MKILVTGGAGFVGKHLVEALTKAGNAVINLDIKSNEQIQNVEHVECDILDEGKLFSLFKSKGRDIDAVIHLAARSEGAARKESYENPELFFRDNVQGTFNLLRATTFTGAKTFVFPSSYLVYGNPYYLPVDETHILKPQSFYAATKVYGESLCNTFSELYGLDVVCLRKCNVYGAGDTTKRVITIFIERAKAGEDITVFGDKILDFVYVEDVVKAYLGAIKYGKTNVFNIGSGKGTSLLELAEIVRQAINPKIKIIKKPQAATEVSNFIANIKKAKETLNFNPTGEIKSFVKEWA